MRRTFRILAAAAAAALMLSGGAAQLAPQATAERFRAHVSYLASDHLRGRDTGSAGHALAADYVAGQFRSLGLQPGGTDGGWYQQVPLRHATHAAVPAATIILDDRKLQLASGRDFALRPSIDEKHRSFEAPLVFVGHGVSEPLLGIDEYAGLDVRGKLVVTLRGLPDGLPAEIAAHLEASKERVAAEQGAAGLIELSFSGYNPVVGRAAWPILDWADSNGESGGSGDLRAVLALSPEMSRRVFEGAPRSLDSVRSAARSAIPGFPLRAQLSIKADSAWQDFRSPNVVARLPGSDPTVAGEQVVLMAHLDHLGFDPAAGPRTDGIFNGALDNAAGVATLIEAARSFVEDGHRPRRTVLFVATTGEERGLLGADYFAAHPPARPEERVALVNLDMPLLTYDFSDVIGFGADHSTIGRAVAEAGRPMRVASIPDPMPEQSLFIRSDHYRFVVRGIPSIFVMTGYGNGGREEWIRYLTRVYHRPGDEVSPAIDWRAGAKFTRLNYRLARLLADAAVRPHWYMGDYFGDRYAPGSPRAARRP